MYNIGDKFKVVKNGNIGVVRTEPTKVNYRGEHIVYGVTFIEPSGVRYTLSVFEETIDYNIKDGSYEMIERG